MIKSLAFILLSIALLAVAPASAQDQSRYGKQKVIYHLNVDGGPEDKAYLQALRNIQNHIDAVGKNNVEIKVVMHADGVLLLKNANSNLRLQSQIINLKNQKVGFLVCDNTLKARKIDAKDLFELERADIVPSGVAELAHLQSQGYVYIKP
jgi:hypothetical protein